MKIWKRRICVAGVCALLLTGAVGAYAAETPLWGDADGDGVITTTDARLLLSEAMHSGDYLPGTPEREERMARMRHMDVDGDDAITTTDARLILQRAIDKIKQFPAEVL